MRAFSSNSLALTSERLNEHPVECAAAIATQHKSPRPRRAVRGAKVALDRHAVSESASPFVVEQEIACEECGGSGRDIGSLDPWDGDVCEKCAGTGRQTITRNYLAEAFQISANPDSIRPVERQHLVAVIQHCREIVGALMSFPEVA
jgi:hypothetical protein